MAALRPITEDAGDEEGAPAAWQVKGNGAQSCVAIKSLKWPGALAVCRAGGTAVSNVYVGFGLPSTMGKTYTPPMPPKVNNSGSVRSIQQQRFNATKIEPLTHTHVLIYTCNLHVGTCNFRCSSSGQVGVSRAKKRRRVRTVRRR